MKNVLCILVCIAIGKTIDNPTWYKMFTDGYVLGCIGFVIVTAIGCMLWQKQLAK